MKRILFDVGANDGSQWLDTLTADQDNTLVFMFEPTPILCDAIRERYKHLKNWTLVQKAVSNYEGISQFNVAGHADWGCSSLMDFREEITSTWPSQRTDLNFTDSVDVEVITLEGFLNNNPTITHIDYLHIDAQGSDLNVLMGLEKYIDIVRHGQMEAAYNAPLYKHSPTHIECIEWLKNKKFTTEVHNANHECDIYFHNTRV